MPPPDSPTPEEEARLRRLLAESRADEPMPDHVAQRLDDTLAELGQERAHGAADVVPLDLRRRRRTVTGLLAAAAVVVVAGVGVTEVLRNGDDEGVQSSAGQAASPPDRSALEEGAAADDGASSPDEALEDRAAADSGGVERKDAPLEVHDGPWQAPRIGEQRLKRDALRVRRALPPGAMNRYDEAVLWAPNEFTCEPVNWGTGVFVGVRYAGSNAVLALREPSKQNQVVEVLQCGTGEALRSVTLTAP